jgi:hypothetical protein
MKKHVRLLYASAVVALLAAGFAMKAENDTLAAKAGTPSSAVAHHGSTP